LILEHLPPSVCCVVDLHVGRLTIALNLPWLFLVGNRLDGSWVWIQVELLSLLVSLEFLETKVSSSDYLDSPLLVSFTFAECIEWLVVFKTIVLVLSFGLEVWSIVLSILDNPSLILTIMLFPSKDITTFGTLVVCNLKY
jgi:hypothetical protein